MGSKKPIIIVIVAILLAFFIANMADNPIEFNLFEDKTFRLISSESHRLFDQDLKDYAKSQGIKLTIDYYGDLEMVDILNGENQNYDAVWISNSIWLYQLDNSYLVTDSKSIAINPVVLGITKSKAKELGFVDTDVYNKDILNVIRDKKLKYIMTTVTKTNTGATAYFGFLNSLAGSPEVLTSEMLHDPGLIQDMKAFFKGVERTSGDEAYLEDMFINGDYEAVINYESTLININQQLTSKGKEPLYLIYPVDGVALNDMPFGYVNRGQSEAKKKQFKILQDYLRSEEVRDMLEAKGYRSWYGGVKKTSNSLFNKEWGIDTTKYLISLKYPSKSVMNEAFDLYVELFRKPAHVVFCLDISGSMYGDGISQLKDAMQYILNADEARKDRIQFSDSDLITVITFNSNVDGVTQTYRGNDVEELQSYIDNLNANGGTNIYDSSIKALEILKDYDPETYTRTVILMTDGHSNYGSYSTLESFYNNKLRQTIPEYTIMFGEASASEVSKIARLTNGKVFDGKSGLKDAFKEVRSYS